MRNEIFNTNDIIFKQGQVQDFMYGLVKGSVGIYVDYGKPEQKQLTTLREGAYLGELGMIDSSPRSATAVALEDGTELELVYIDNLAGYLRNNPDSALSIMRNVSSRIRSVSYELLSLRKSAGEVLKEENRERGWLKKSLARFIGRGAAEQESFYALSKLAGAADAAADAVAYSKDAVVFKVGEEADIMYEIISGKVGIFYKYGSEEQREITVLEAGKFFGEMGLLENLPRSATAVALEDSMLLPISARNFESCFGLSTAKLIPLLHQMTARLRELTKEYKAACSMLSEAAELEAQGKTIDRRFWDAMKNYSHEYSTICSQAAAMGIDITGLGNNHW